MGQQENMKTDQDRWEWVDHAVEMIPFGLLSGFYGEKEIRFTKLSEEGFCFRVAEELPEIRERFRVCFYDLKQSKYQEISVNAGAWKLEARTEFFYSYAVEVRQAEFRQAVQKLFVQYDCYIRLKLEDDDSLLAEEMTGYPAEEDEVFADSMQEQMAYGIACAGSREYDWPSEKFACQKAGVLWQKQAPEFALELDRTELYTAFLEQNFSDFLKRWADCYGVYGQCFRNRKPGRIYIGNAYCPRLFPDENMVEKLLEEAKRRALEVTITFPAAAESRLEWTRNIIGKLDDWGRKNRRHMAVVANDWGTADLLYELRKQPGSALGQEGIGLGVLLNKRKKDPRLRYKKDSFSLLRENSVTADFYQDYLRERFGITAFEWESCGYPQRFPDLENHLHLPLYQTNTSQYCPLYAESEWGDRGQQRPVTDCGERCARMAVLYPRHLSMTGRYNSLFGVDPGILETLGLAEPDMKKTEEFCWKHRIRQLVFSCWST